MEYSLYLSYRCNLRCSFCYVKEKVLAGTESASNQTINDIVKYIGREKQKIKEFEKYPKIKVVGF